MCPRPPAPITTAAVTGAELPGRLRDRVIGGESRIGEGGDVGRFEGVVDLDARCGTKSCRYSAYPPLVSMPGNACSRSARRRRTGRRGTVHR